MQITRTALIEAVDKAIERNLDFAHHTYPNLALTDDEQAALRKVAETSTMVAYGTSEIDDASNGVWDCGCPAVQAGVCVWKFGSLFDSLFRVDEYDVEGILYVVGD